MEGNSRFKIDWASLIVRRKFFFFLYFSLCSRAISKYKPPRGLYSEGRFNGGFFALRVLGGLYLEGLIHGGAYFLNFTVSSEHSGVGGKIRRTEHSVTVPFS